LGFDRNFYSSLFFIVFDIPYSILFYKFSKEEKTASFFVFLEVPNLIGRSIIFSLAILFVSNLQYLFLVAALSYVYFLFFKSNNI